MTNTKIHSAVSEGILTSVISIESQFTRGFAGIQLIGSTTEACREGKDRARAALEAIQIFIPARRLVVSMTPGDIKKMGNHLDLPMAVSLALLLSDQYPILDPQGWLFAAELGLDGSLKPIRGVIGLTIAAASAGLEGIVVASANLSELAAVESLQVESLKKVKMIGFHHLGDLMSWLFRGDVMAAIHPRDRGGIGPEGDASGKVQASLAGAKPNFDDMVLSAELQKAALVCATGLHSIILRGHPGTGKSMFAERLPSIMPKLKPADHLDVLRILSSHSEALPPGILSGRPPLRAPHHHTSAAAILGRLDCPGELALSHHGVLFLDEFPEFRRDIIEALREPLESGVVRLSRAKGKISWHARILLIAACNNCPCGWFASKRRKCRCPSQKILAYSQRLSGPILDRIDLHLNVLDPVASDTSSLFRSNVETGSGITASLSQQVLMAREFSHKRNVAWGVEFNRDLPTQLLAKASGHHENHFNQLLKRHISLHLSNRALVRVLRVSRTLADLEGNPQIQPEHLDQALLWQAEASASARGEHLFAS